MENQANAEVNRKGEKTALILLSITLLVQLISFAFLWNPEKFRQTIASIKAALNKGKDKVKSTFKKEEQD